MLKIYSHLDPILVLAVEDLHGLDSLRNRAATSYKDAIDIEGEGKAVCYERVFFALGRGYGRVGSVEFRGRCGTSGRAQGWSSFRYGRSLSRRIPYQQLVR
jgi:hypothetical protein